jgi:hypothetical protein
MYGHFPAHRPLGRQAFRQNPNMGKAKILIMLSERDTLTILAWTLKEEEDVNLFDKWCKDNQLMFLNVNDAWTLIAQYFSNEALLNLEVIVGSRRITLD